MPRNPHHFHTGKRNHYVLGQGILSKNEAIYVTLIPLRSELKDPDHIEPILVEESQARALAEARRRGLVTYDRRKELYAAHGDQAKIWGAHITSKGEQFLSRGVRS